MNERFIYLNEKYLSGKLNKSESAELDELLNQYPELKDELEEQKRVKEVLHKMKLKNPEKEVWDRYWLGIYNKIERGVGWIIVSIGAIILLSYSAITALNNFINDTTTPLIVKIGISIFVIGFVILFVSLLREKLFKTKHDKYKEIQR